MDGRCFMFLCSASIALKLLLIRAYRSTDFEVHRNWLAITSSLSWEEWYLEKTSEWTLDYPPLFAWFEFLLAKFARGFDPKMLVLTNLNYESDGTILFQRMSVIISDFVFYFAVYRIVSHFLKEKYLRESLGMWMPYASLFVFNFGLILVDHIHFQYNGILMGIWLLSILRIVQKRHLEGALWFSILLNMKHIYLYVAPAYFVYLLGHYCMTVREDGSLQFHVPRFLKLASIVTVVFGISFGPFILKGLLKDVLTRLFPFKRGLCHAYWAPNVWALYNFIDKICGVVLRRVSKGPTGNVTTASMTGGLVQEFDHEVLPTIKPIHTLILTVILMLPFLLRLYRKTDKLPSQMFVEAVILCAWTSFLCGWHVHEKAILLVILPMVFLLPLKARGQENFKVISTVGHYSLLPLIFTSKETPFKIALLLLSVVSTYFATDKLSKNKFPGVSVFRFLRNSYLLGLLPLFLYTDCVHSFLDPRDKLPFLPLLMTSVYCAVGVVSGYVISYCQFFQKCK